MNNIVTIAVGALGGAVVAVGLIGSLMAWLGGVWAKRIELAANSKHQENLETVKAQYQKELEQF